MDISTWQQQIRDGLREQDDLIRMSGLDQKGFCTPKTAIKTFPPRVPMAYMERIEQNNPNDPLLRQVLAVAEEDIDSSGFSHDPVGEFNKHASPGLIRKYHGRALLIATSTCAIHCRYCFRRHYPYQDNHASRDNWNDALDTLRTDPSIREIILSGGDPLSLTDDRLQSLIQQLEHIPHLQWLRIHTRMPVVIPDRVTSELVDTISRSRFKQSLVIHVNHPNEIDDKVAVALKRLHKAGIHLLNQSVLLKGVNDDVLILTELSAKLYSNHVIPYYLHMLDPVAGAAHFEVDETSARDIIKDLRGRLPGYLVPRLVREIEGLPYKAIV